MIMNGTDVEYLNGKFIELDTKFKERWNAHEVSAVAYREYLKDELDNIKKLIEGQQLKISLLPCLQHTNDFGWIKKNVYALWGALATCIVIVFKWITNIK
jgi:hypothetical protein